MESGIALITVSGRLAVGGETERLDAAVKGLIQKEQKHFIFDIAKLEYVDSSGIGMLVSSLTNIRKAGGDMKVAGANPRIRRIFSMTGVDTMLPMFNSVAEASA